MENKVVPYDNDTKSKPIYSHSPFKFEYEGIEVEGFRNGKVKLVQSHDDDTFDEIMTSAGLIRRLYFLLRDGRSVSYVDTRKE